jgi:hypothetical protein
MPGGRFVGDTTLVDYSIAGHASLSEVFLVAGYTNNLSIAGNKALVANGLLANFATETLFMPLLALVLILLHASPEDVLTAITASGKVVVMTVSAVEFFIL